MLDKDDYAAALEESYQEALEFTYLSDAEHDEICHDFLRALLKQCTPGTAAHAELLGLILDLEEE